MGHKLTDKNRLSIINPKLCTEWDYDKNNGLKPEDLQYSSKIKIWWKCKNNHEWPATPSDRVIKGSECPYCTNKLPTPEKTFAYLYPDLLKHWSYEDNTIDPSKIHEKSGRNVCWKCPKCGLKHNTQVRVKIKFPYCPYCEKKLASHFYNFKLDNPSSANDWDYEANYPYRPENFTPHSHFKEIWTCSNGHKSTKEIREYSHGGCPLCKKIILKDGTELDSLSEILLYVDLRKNFQYLSINKKYPKEAKLGDMRYDFYVEETKTYYETTSFSKEDNYDRCTSVSKKGGWFKYLRKIVKKKIAVEKILKAKFIFIQKKLSYNDIKTARNFIFSAPKRIKKIDIINLAQS